jgi:hypothetical protein
MCYHHADAACSASGLIADPAVISVMTDPQNIGKFNKFEYFIRI